MNIYFVLLSLIRTLTFGLRYSRSEKSKFICFFAHLIVPLLLSCAENALCGMGGRGARHNKRRLLRFGSDG